jgi:flagellar basal-body rod modification protein FlgD
MNVTDSSITASYLATPDRAAASTRKSSLDADDFVKLLAVQFQTQDPMNPVTDTAFIAQMSQFTALEQTNSLIDSLASLRADQQFTTAAAYLGRTVTVSDGEDGVISGVVSAIEHAADGPRIVIGEFSYSLRAVLLVENGPKPQPEAATPTES